MTFLFVLAIVFVMAALYLFSLMCPVCHICHKDVSRIEAYRFKREHRGRVTCKSCIKNRRPRH